MWVQQAKVIFVTIEFRIELFEETMKVIVYTWKKIVILVSGIKVLHCNDMRCVKFHPLSQNADIVMQSLPLILEVFPIRC